MNFDLYKAAQEADDMYSAELIRAYGAKAASDRRYQMAPHADVAVQTARDAKLNADVLWLAEMNRRASRNRHEAQCKIPHGGSECTCHS